MVRKYFCDKIPELLGVVEFFEVAKLMHDEIIGEVWREVQDAVIEVDIPALRAAAPASFLIASADILIGESVVCVQYRYSLRREM